MDQADHEFNFDTLAVRAGTLRSEFNEHSEALFLTSSFCFGSAAEAAERFAHSEDGFTYSRFSNPTVSMFQNRLAALEGGEACIATASGMSAIMSVVMCAMQAGDHLVSSQSIFGSTLQMFSACTATVRFQPCAADSERAPARLTSSATRRAASGSQLQTSSA